MTAALVLEQVSLMLGNFGLRDISLTLDPGQVLVVLGPSGAGKSVLLETIAGFYRPRTGRILVGGRDVTALPPEARRIGFMFQDYALFPHLTVLQNIQFACPKDHKRARGLLHRLGLAHLGDRRPQHLSGGEQQRVALARALAMEPALFLFDEPLSALDAPSRDAVRHDLQTLLSQVGLPAVYVTHDQTEALVMADRLAVLHDGTVLQVGTSAQIFNHPCDEFVARFVGVETVLEGQALSSDDGLVRIAVGRREIFAVAEVVPQRVLVCIRPEDVALGIGESGRSSVRNHFVAVVKEVASSGPLFRVTLDCGFPLVAVVTKQSFLELGLRSGASVVASVKASAIHLIGRGQ